MPAGLVPETTRLPRCDFVLRGGTVIDGSGTPGMRADVAVLGDRIVAVGALAARDGVHEIDARGHVVAPGFIDTHTHDDHALLTRPAMDCKTSQGVTTVVAGNCGVSLAPAVLTRPLPPTFGLLGGESGFRFAEFASYADAIDRAPPAVNAACLVGHSTLRLGDMDDLDRPATGDEIASMRTRFARAFDEGAIGLSTGLYYPASRAATTEEVVGLASVMRDSNGVYATHMRDESDGVEESLEEALRIGREAGVTVLVSHHKVIGPKNFGRSVRTLARIDRATGEQRVGLDLYPYIAGSTMLDPNRCRGQMRVLVTWSRPHPEQAGRDIDAIAADWGCDTHAAAQRLLPAGAIYFMLDEADVQRIMAYPLTMIGSDGLPHDQHPHPRLWGTFPRVLGHYARALGLMTMEEAVHRMTQLPARFFGLADRGEIRAGAYADIVVFDPATVIDRATFESPEAVATGIRTVIVNGQAVWEDGAASARRPGRMLRRTGSTGH
jgi:N-acyl-D-amino-acid deacylase